MARVATLVQQRQDSLHLLTNKLADTDMEWYYVSLSWLDHQRCEMCPGITARTIMIGVGLTLL